MLKIVLSFLLLLISAPVYAETFYYRINQVGVKVGDATLTLKDEMEYKGERLRLIEFKADGFNFLDQERIYVNPQSFKPRFVERNLNIFGSKEQITETYEDNHILVEKIASGKSTTVKLPKDGDVDNLYGFILRFRQAGQFNLGETVKIKLPTKELLIKVTKETKLEAAGQHFDALYLQSDPPKYKIWFDKSTKHLPLRISGAVGIANTVMILTKYEE